MEQIALLIIVAAVAFIVGLIIGRMIPRNNSEDSDNTQDYSDFSSPAPQQELVTYKADVQRHLDTTAELVNNLTSTYRALHAHLGDANQKLGDASTAISPLAEPKLTADDKPAAEEKYEPTQPRDYVPKTSPTEQGTLSEGYGLRAAQEKAAATAK
ncbi:YhcB family protein [Pokkaliibacter sp. CJK22405]|uniref:YhcB family protein n=1 Tax=Pokkaliibacter sp. CJK22405 TaxID=3384615 RepID=UPI0039855EAB